MPVFHLSQLPVCGLQAGPKQGHEGDFVFFTGTIPNCHLFFHQAKANIQPYLVEIRVKHKMVKKNKEFKSVHSPLFPFSFF